MNPGYRFARQSLLPILVLIGTPALADTLTELNNRAVAAARDGRLEDAYRLLQEAIASEPRFAVVQDNLTRVVEAISRRDYGKALEVDPAPKELALRTLEPPAETTASTAALDETGILTLLTDWSGAWSAQDVDAYLGWYAQDFEPPNGLDRRAWEAVRRERLRRPQWVQVRIGEVEIVANDGRTARVRFVQDYRSDRYRDRTRKELRLIRTADGWRIQAERSL